MTCTAWRLLAALIGFLPAAAHAAEPGGVLPPGKSYVYKHSAGEPQMMEVYLPPNHDPAKAKVPGVLMFHGGGWNGGDLSQFRFLCHYLAGRGLVAATAKPTDVQLAEGHPHGFFNRDPWRTVTTMAADRFLVRQGILQGETTLTAPASGEQLVPAGPPNSVEEKRE